MTLSKSIVLLVVSIILTMLFSGFVSAANCGGAVQCSCGDTLTSSHTMWYDMLGCGPSYGLRIGADSITLDCAGHTISSSGYDFGIKIENRNYVTIKNCHMDHWGNNIYLYYSDNNNILNNTLTLGSHGVYAFNSDHNTFDGNTIPSGGYGIFLWDSVGNDLINNYVSHINQMGIYLDNSNRTVIRNNNASSNRGGIYLFESSHNNLTDNIANNNEDDGIYVRNSDNNRILRNTASNNGWVGTGYGGIFLMDSNYNVIEFNKAYNNYRNGLVFYGSDWGNTVYDNEFCYSSIFYDISDPSPSSGVGDRNTCDTTDYWNDQGAIGCTYPCGVCGCKGATQIFTCGQTITESCNMNCDLNSTGACFFIGTPGITIDGMGHKLTGDGTGEGIHNPGYNSVTIRNFNITNFATGVYLYNSYYNLILNNNISNNPGYGIFMDSSGYSTLFNNLLDSNSFNGISLHQSSGHNHVYNNTATSNWHGISIRNSGNNKIYNNIAKFNSVSGIDHTFSAYSNISNNIAQENTQHDISVWPGHFSECNNDIYNNIGSGNRPLKYFDTTVNLQDEVLAGLILCNADNSVIRNVTIIGSATINNSGMFTYWLDNPRFDSINSSHNWDGLVLAHSNNALVNNSFFKENNVDGLRLGFSTGGRIMNTKSFGNGWFGVFVSETNNSIVEGNEFYNDRRGINFRNASNIIVKKNTLRNNVYGMYLNSSEDNLQWNNTFVNNSVNAYEDAISNNNEWNLSKTGNYWSDFESSTGYPNNYPIDGPGDGVDYYPKGRTSVQTIFFSEYRDTNNVSYDNVTGGGPCNQPGPCYGNDISDARYCPVNHCVLNDVCYAGNGSVVMDIDGTSSTHLAICVGYGWWDCDSGLPGMSVCGLCGYNWTNATSSSVGEYQWHNGTGYGCCGDDTGEYLHGDGICYPYALRKPKLKKELPIEEPEKQGKRPITTIR